MGLPATALKRLRELAREAKTIISDYLVADDQAKTFAELEDECIEAGDLITATMLELRITAKQDDEQAVCCPTCNQPGERCPDEPRVLQTDRGEVTWMEPVYYCRDCRRSFFPSLGRIGIGGGRYDQSARTKEGRLCGDVRS